MTSVFLSYRARRGDGAHREQHAGSTGLEEARNRIAGGLFVDPRHDRHVEARWVPPLRLAVPRQPLEVRGELFRSTGNGEPTIGPFGGELHSARTMDAAEDGNRPLNRVIAREDCREVDMFTVVLGRVFGPHPAHGLDDLPHALESGAVFYPEEVELLDQPTGPGSDGETPLRLAIQRGECLGEE